VTHMVEFFGRAPQQGGGRTATEVAAVPRTTQV